MVRRPSSFGIGPVDAWNVLSSWSGENFELTNKVTVENIVPNDRRYNRICHLREIPKVYSKVQHIWSFKHPTRSVVKIKRETTLKSSLIPGAVQEIIVLCSICPPLPTWRKWQCNDAVLDTICYELTEIPARGLAYLGSYRLAVGYSINCYRREHR